MFAFFPGASFKIARNLIKVTGLKESLAVFQKNNFSNIGDAEVLKILIAVDACNLLQTMKEEFISHEISEDDLQDTVEDYVVENLKDQTVIACRDGADRMDQCQEILGIAAKFQDYWHREDTKDPGPRFYCVKELLRRLNCQANTPIHDAFFEFVYEQHNRFNRYFRILLEPFREEAAPEAFLPEPPPLSVAISSPVLEPLVSLLPAAAELNLKKEIPVMENLLLASGLSPLSEAVSAPAPEPEAPPEDRKATPPSKAFRALDLQDPLSGFPIEKPWPGKIKSPEAPVLASDHPPEPSAQGKPLEPATPPGPETPSHPLPPPVEAQKKNSGEEKTASKAYRQLDLQDTLSGFPIERPWPGKIKTAEVPAPPAEIKLDPSVQEKPPESAAFSGPDASATPLQPPVEGGEDNAEEKAAPLAGKDAAPKTFKAQAYRELDLQDTLSGFPIERPWPGKSKASEVPEKLSPADKNLMPLHEEISPKPPDAGPSLADLDKKEIPAGEDPSGPDPLARFSGLEPLPDEGAVLEKPMEALLNPTAPLEMEGDGEEDVEKSTAAEIQTPEDELETKADPLWEEAKGKDSLFPSEDGAEKSALDLSENPAGGTAAPAPKSSLPAAGNLYPENLLPAPPKIFSEENLPKSLRPTPQMLEDLFNQVNPIDPGESKSN